MILDIGATLVSGPTRGPASRIAARAGLDETRKLALREGLMTRPFTSPREVVAFTQALDGPIVEQLDRAVADVWHAQEREAEPIADAAEAVRRLHEHGLRLAVISNIWRPYLRSVRTHFGELFDAHVAPELQLFSFREGFAKPAPELFRRALERAGVAAADAVMIGDSYAEDIAPADALGIGTVWVLHRPQREVGDVARVLNCEARGASRTVRSISEVTVGLVASVLARSPASAHAN